MVLTPIQLAKTASYLIWQLICSNPSYIYRLVVLCVFVMYLMFVKGNTVLRFFTCHKKEPRVIESLVLEWASLSFILFQFVRHK